MMKKTKQGRNKRRIAAIILLVCLCLGAIPFILNGIVIFSTRKYHISPEEAGEKNFDCILVLGARAYPNGVPSHMLEDRILKGIEVFEIGASEKLLMSGGHEGEDYDEPITMKNYAVERFVPAESIIMDNEGYSTYESLYRAKEIYGVESLIVVTQNYHLYRAMYIGKQLGLEVYGVDSDLRQYRTWAYNILREFMARCKDFIYCILMPEPGSI